MQQIPRMHTSMYLENPELLRYFGQLAGIVFRFFLYWSSEEIYTYTYCLYSSNLPEQEAESLFIDQVRNFLNEYKIREREQIISKILFTLTVNGNQHQDNLQKRSTKN